MGFSDPAYDGQEGIDRLTSLLGMYLPRLTPAAPPQTTRVLFHAYALLLIGNRLAISHVQKNLTLI